MMINKLKSVISRYDELAELMSQPDAMKEMKSFTRLAREHRGLTELVEGMGEKRPDYKIEFCDSTSTATSCNGAVIVYDGTSSGGSGYIDIANTDAGVAAMALGSYDNVEFGAAYSYVQLTMQRDMKVSGYAADGSGTTCYTDANGADNSPATGSTSAGDQTEVTLYAAYDANGANLNAELDGLPTLGGTPLLSDVNNGDDYFRWREAFDADFILKAGNIPTFSIAFGFDNAVGATGDMDTGAGDACGQSDGTAGASIGMYADAPDVAISWE